MVGIRAVGSPRGRDKHAIKIRRGGIASGIEIAFCSTARSGVLTRAIVRISSFARCPMTENILRKRPVREVTRARLLRFSIILTFRSCYCYARKVELSRRLHSLARRLLFSFLFFPSISLSSFLPSFILSVSSELSARFWHVN